jgi:autotransporter translocation and assembly factor TamB
MLSQLRGELIGELQLQGSVDQPLAYGQLQLKDAELGLVGNPTALQKLQVSLELNGERVTIAGEGVLGGGPVRLQGELGLQPELSLELSVAGERQNILYPPATELLLSEQLKITANPGLFSVSGDITVHEGTLEPEDLPEGSVALSADVVEVDYTGKPISEQLPFDVAMDVRVLVENKFTVRSSILFATLGGELRLLQRRREPLQLFGNLNVVGGELRAYQQQLKIRRGTLSFSGRPDNPSVNVRAERTISGENVVVGMQVRGSYDALSLQVFSEPAMSQGEAMSYLVRGRGLDASTGEDGTAMALSLASGAVNRTTLVSELNRIPGVSNVSFGADGTADDTAATVSGYLGERIYLSYGVGLYEPINVLIAKLYLRTRLWLEVVSRLENSLDLYYAFDID